MAARQWGNPELFYPIVPASYRLTYYYTNLILLFEKES
jgi:hypothetical protein